jgi:hypothetical protein
MPRIARVTDPSYELMDDHNGLSIIYRQHGFPCPLVRWHFHKEYELHLIVASSGKVFIGDYIGNFYPQTLFLTGPNLPHNRRFQQLKGMTPSHYWRLVVQRLTEQNQG